ncbi:N-acetyltransferase [Clostridium polynesiense]|uniref:N-acetyltransferase n=1 Tax=Clostridium polynesiense TaxID=1325933 RepID=UPI00058FB5C0|nr:N-acetyltransferase [Clostridium polynesiense]
MIRKLKNEDTDKIMDIWKESTIKAHHFINKEYWENNYDTVRDIYLPQSDTFVYDEEGNIKGFISIINSDFIGALFVDCDCQGLGIGSKLIDCVIKKYKKLTLAVYKDNEKAVKFYESKGFKIVKEQENQDSGFQEYIMEI